MSRRGRLPTLNEKKKAEILAILFTGCKRQTAADYVGCDLKTIYNTALREPEFEEQLGRTESSSELHHLRNINAAGKETRFWRASAWFLERQSPDRYGVRSPDSVTPEQLKSLISCITKMLVEEVPVARYRKQILARMQKLLASTPDAIEKNYQRRKNALEKTIDFSIDTPSYSEQNSEKPQNLLAKPEGTNQST